MALGSGPMASHSACEVCLHAKRAQEGIRLHLALTEHFRKCAGTDMPPGIHLPEAILRMDESLREEQVMQCAGVDVRNAHGIPVHLDLSVDALYVQLTIDLRERLGGDHPWQIAIEIGEAARGKKDCDHQHA